MTYLRVVNSLKEDFVFSEHWLNTMTKVESHPFDKILFSQVQEDLEDQIKNNKKKEFLKKERG